MEGWPVWLVFGVLWLGAFTRGNATYWVGRGVRAGGGRSRFADHLELRIKAEEDAQSAADHRVIVDNPRVHDWAAWWASMPGIRPLLKASYTLSWTMGGGAPLAFHAFNVACHAASACLVFALARRWTDGSPVMPWAGAPAFSRRVMLAQTRFLSMDVLSLVAIITDLIFYIHLKSNNSNM